MTIDFISESRLGSLAWWACWRSRLRRWSA